MVKSPPTPPSVPSDWATELAECGWRIDVVTQPDGTTTEVQVPLGKGLSPFPMTAS